MPARSDSLTVTIEKAVHGGKGMARLDGGTVVFVPGVLPGERVQIAITERKGKSAEARLLAILKPSPDRMAPRCDHAGESRQCDFQHIAPAARLRLKTTIVQDQFERLGKLRQLPLRPILPNPTPLEYRIETVLSPSAEGPPGYWSRSQRRVVPVRDCHALHPQLRAVLPDIDLQLPDLRRMVLRVGSDGALLLALETEEAEPPELSADFPVSVALVLPDGVAATLIGDPWLVQAAAGRFWQVSAGAFFHPSLAGATLLHEVVQELAALTGAERVLDGFAGVGFLTAGLAARAREVVAVERNEAAVEDAAVNLDETENVSIYNGWLEDVPAELAQNADLWVLDADEGGLSAELLALLRYHRPPRLIVSQPDIGTAARDARQIGAAGYRLTALHPLDMEPLSHHVHTVSAWQHQTA
jgi:23S rRNA (uracil1939-C5)-methyltransferase